jgi:2-polyprenyl-3-methyl-5-hydroxy-6-metoxy-1,4-benzoquinol methylase
MKAEYCYETAEARWDHSIVLPPIMAALRDLPAGASLLDIGCGNGALLSEIGRYGNWSLCAVETSSSGVEIARSRGIDARLADGNGDLSTIFPRQFDLVISIEVIEHVPEACAFLHAAYRMLRPGGKIVISTPYHGYLKNLLVAVLGQCDSHYNPLWETGHIKFWSRKTLLTAMRDAGFQGFEFYGAGRFPFLWKSMVITARR